MTKEYVKAAFKLYENLCDQLAGIEKVLVREAPEHTPMLIRHKLTQLYFRESRTDVVWKSIEHFYESYEDGNPIPISTVRINPTSLNVELIQPADDDMPEANISDGWRKEQIGRLDFDQVYAEAAALKELLVSCKTVADLSNLREEQEILSVISADSGEEIDWTTAPKDTKISYIQLGQWNEHINFPECYPITEEFDFDVMDQEYTGMLYEKNGSGDGLGIILQDVELDELRNLLTEFYKEQYGCEIEDIPIWDAETKTIKILC